MAANRLPKHPVVSALQVDEARVQSLAKQITMMLQSVVVNRQNKLWERGRYDLSLLVRALDIAIRGMDRTDGLRLALENGEEHDGHKVYKLALSHGAEKLILDVLEVPVTGHYPIRAQAKIAADIAFADAVLMNNQDELTVRILGHFSDPKSAMAELLERCAAD